MLAELCAHCPVLPTATGHRVAKSLAKDLKLFHCYNNIHCVAGVALCLTPYSPVVKNHCTALVSVLGLTCPKIAKTNSKLI